MYYLLVIEEGEYSDFWYENIGLFHEVENAKDHAQQLHNTFYASSCQNRLYKDMNKKLNWFDNEATVSDLAQRKYIIIEMPFED